MENSVINTETEENISQGAITVGDNAQLKIFRKQRKDKVHRKLPFNSHYSNNKSTKRNGRKPNTCFKCVLEDHFIVNIRKTDTSDNGFTGTHKSLKLMHKLQHK